MPEIGTLGLMSGDGKRSAGHRPQATAPILDFTLATRSLATVAAPILTADITSRRKRERGGRRVNQAKRAMQDAVEKIIDQKKHEPLGTEEAERKVADERHKSAKEVADRDPPTAG